MASRGVFPRATEEKVPTVSTEAQLNEPIAEAGTDLPRISPDVRWKSRLGVVVLQQFFAGSGFAVFSLMPKFLAKSLHLSDDTIGVISAGMPGGALLFSPLLAYLIERFSRVRILQSGLLLFTVCSLLVVPLSHTRAALLPLAVVLGGAMVMVFNTAGAISAELVPGTHIARAVGLHGASNMLGYAVAPAVAEIVASRFGWTETFSLACVMGLVALSVTLFIEEPGRVQLTAEESGKSVGKAIALFAVASMACGIAHFALYVFHQTHIFAQGGTEVRSYFLGFTVGAFVMRVFFGGIPDRFGHARVATITLALYALITMLAVYMTPSTLAYFGLAQGIMHGVFYPALVALGVTRAGSSAKGRTITWLYGMFNLGSMLAGLGVGAISEEHGTRVAFLVSGALTAFGVLALLPSALAERRERQRLAGTTRTSSM